MQFPSILSLRVRVLASSVGIAIGILSIGACGPVDEDVGEGESQQQSVVGNLLSNPGFESGTTNWQDWGNSRISSNAASGGAALEVGTNAGGRAQYVNGALAPGACYIG